MADYIERQFDEPSMTRDSVIDDLQRRLTVSRAESKQLARLKVNADNYGRISSLKAVDSVYLVRRLLRNGDDLVLADYLTGRRADPPEVDEWRLRNEAMAQGIRYDERIIDASFRSTRTVFQHANPAARAVMLQPLLASQFDAPGGRATLVQRALGANADNRLALRFFSSYVDRLPEREQRAVIAYIIGRSAGTGESASLKTVLEAMGPLGIKAGQFLRSSAALPAHLRAGLDDFFDAAMPPARDVIYADLERVFGPAMENVVSVGELLGSGSLNYVVAVRLRHPRTGQTEDVVVRVQRAAARGQVVNENAVLRGVVADLAGDDDPQVRAAGRIADDALSYAFDTIMHRELDQADERGLYPRAVGTYERRAPDPRTGLRGATVAPRRDLQAMVLPGMQSQASIYDRVGGRSLLAIEDPTRRAAVATQMLERELDAILIRGEFDPDGTPGNSLVDEQAGVLVRLDYAQLTSLSEPQRRAVRRVLLGLHANDRSRIAATFASSFDVLFEGSARPADLDAVAHRIVSSPEFPLAEGFEARLLFLQERVARHYQNAGQPSFYVRLARPGVQAAFAALARTQMYRDYVGDAAYRLAVARRLHWVAAAAPAALLSP